MSTLFDELWAAERDRVRFRVLESLLWISRMPHRTVRHAILAHPRLDCPRLPQANRQRPSPRGSTTGLPTYIPVEGWCHYVRRKLLRIDGWGRMGKGRCGRATGRDRSNRSRPRAAVDITRLHWRDATQRARRECDLWTTIRSALSKVSLAFPFQVFLVGSRTNNMGSKIAL